MSVLRALCILAACLWAPVSVAQSIAPPDAPTVERLIELAQDETVTDIELQYYLTPLDAAQIEEVAEFWRLRFREGLAEVSAIAIALEDATSTEQTRLQEVLREANANSIDNFDRYLVVLSSYNRKGGPEEDLQRHRAYVSGVLGDLTLSFRISTLGRVTWQWLISAQGGIRILIDIFQLVLSIALAVVLSKFLKTSVTNWLKRSEDTDSLYLQFVPGAVFWFVFLVGLVMALWAQGMDIQIAAAIIGGCGLAVAFLFRSLIPSLAGGLVLASSRPYERGDTVAFEGILGRVDGFNPIATTLRTFDNRQVVIPNNKVWQGAIENLSRFPVRRIDLVFGIGYDDDVELAKRTLVELVESDERCLKKPALRVFVGDLGLSSVNVYCRPWVRTDDYWDVMWDLTEAAKKRLQEAGVTIAYQQHDLHIRSSEVAERLDAIAPPDAVAKLDET